MNSEIFHNSGFLVKLLCSLTVAYMIGTYIEYIFHKFVGHPPDYLADLFERSPKWLKGSILEAQAGHDIHHFLTKENFYNQTPSTLDQFKHIKKLVLLYPALKKHNDNTRFGMSFDVYSILSASMLTVPISLLVLYLGAGVFLWYIVVPLPIVLITIASRYVHPLIHFSCSDLVNSKNPFIRFIAQNAYYKYVKRRHFLHHKMDGRVSYNLVPGFEQLVSAFNALWLKVIKKR